MILFRVESLDAIDDSNDNENEGDDDEEEEEEEEDNDNDNDDEDDDLSTMLVESEEANSMCLF